MEGETGVGRVLVAAFTTHPAGGVSVCEWVGECVRVSSESHQRGHQSPGG